jgi:mannose-6-phosphate isomerase-like protein (cupin superfamily)
MYIIRYNDLERAIDPRRKLVKLAEANLWKQPWPEGISAWQEGYEIRSPAVGISLFTTGTEEKLHFHERTWEFYQVLKGSLKVAIKPYRKSAYSVVELNELDMVLLTPGTLHLVDSSSNHVTQVIQIPPSISDQHIVIDQDEYDAAKEAFAQPQSER